MASEHLTNKIFAFFLMTLMLLGLPLLGAALLNKPISPYLEFPPETRYVQQAPFSWIAFFGYGLFTLAVIVPFMVRGLKKNKPNRIDSPSLHGFPVWGWVGIFIGVIAWLMAWNRFSWFEVFQAHTFTPLWVAYIITVNAMTFRRKGSCMLLERPGRFLSLFIMSAAFWWFFEYLNRFVQNWYYIGKTFGPWEYFLYATLPFSTVLPAVISTRECLLTFAWPQNKFRLFMPISVTTPRVLAWTVLLFSGVGLGCIGVWPNLLFPLLWISPLLVLVSLQTLMGEANIFSDLSVGDWRFILCSALAALMCGFFWEMWNFYSFAKWKYSIPYVGRFHIFEMPIMGYAGYLPFGLVCAVISDMVLSVRE